MRQYIEQDLVLVDGESGGSGLSTGTGGTSGSGGYVIPTGGNSGGGGYVIPTGGNSGGGSQVVEPDLINPVVFINNPKNDVIPSDTTDETKTYLDGGTTPDSNINVKKPEPNYLTLGVLGIIGLLVIYKVFFNKKSE
jgi:hypothetical protein